jgi:hypothetical protein
MDPCLGKSRHGKKSKRPGSFWYCIKLRLESMGGRACKQIGYEVHQNQHLPRAIKNLSPEMFKMDKNGNKKSHEIQYLCRKSSIGCETIIRWSILGCCCPEPTNRQPSKSLLFTHPCRKKKQPKYHPRLAKSRKWETSSKTGGVDKSITPRISQFSCETQNKQKKWKK